MLNLRAHTKDVFEFLIRYYTALTHTSIQSKRFFLLVVTPVSFFPRAYLLLFYSVLIMHYMLIEVVW